MRGRILVLAGAIGAGIGMLALVDRPERPATGTVIVTSRTAPPQQTIPSQASVPPGAPPNAVPSVEAAVAEPPSGAPANYAYWEGSDAGVWSAPAQFSPAR